MKSYKVKFLPSAKQDLRTSFLWGVNMWGKAQAERWLREIYATCKNRLSQFPESCPIAPEGEDFGRELRQFIVNRYRVIFTVKDDIVTILYVRGAYSGTVFDSEDEEG